MLTVYLQKSQIMREYLKTNMGLFCQGEVGAVRGGTHHCRRPSSQTRTCTKLSTDRFIAEQLFSLLNRL